MSEQMPPGYVWNCYTKSRDGDGPLFVAHDDTVTARLDGYAVVPREEYDALTAELAAFRAFLTECGCGGVGDANGMHDLAQHQEELIADNQRQAARIARLAAALRPFADAYRAAVKELPWPVDAPMWEAASAALAAAPGEGT